MILCKYMSGELLDKEELEALLPLIQAIQTQIRDYPHFHLDGTGLEISQDWTLIRSRICIDEGVKMMYVAIAVARRVEVAQQRIEANPYMYASQIQIFEGYGMDVDLPTKVDFIIYEPTEEARARKRLSDEDTFILKLIREKHLVDPNAWQRVLFI